MRERERERGRESTNYWFKTITMVEIQMFDRFNSLSIGLYTFHTKYLIIICMHSDLTTNACLEFLLFFASKTKCIGLMARVI